MNRPPALLLYAILVVTGAGIALLAYYYLYHQSHSTFDAEGRLIEYASKQTAPCPPQTPDTGVLLVIGQSNVANRGERKFITRYPRQVFNYYNGSCTIAASPLLGASGDGGEFLTPLADRLVNLGVYRTVIILSASVGGSEIARWQEGGDLNDAMLTTLTEAQKHYDVTDIIWQQGESDFRLSTSPDTYVESFKSLLSSLRKQGVDAPVFMSVSTKCQEILSGPWSPDNPLALAQKELPALEGVYLGADTDALISNDDRKIDHCHFRESGQLKAADAFADAIAKKHAETNSAIRQDLY